MDLELLTIFNLLGVLIHSRPLFRVKLCNHLIMHVPFSSSNSPCQCGKTVPTVHLPSSKYCLGFSPTLTHGSLKPTGRFLYKKKSGWQLQMTCSSFCYFVPFRLCEKECAILGVNLDRKEMITFFSFNPQVRSILF